MVLFYGLYGMGAVIITIFSKYFNKNKFTLFVCGFIIGAITEYITSFLIEVIMNTRWWDYTNYVLNINGRICLLYSFFWGILTPILIKTNETIDKIIDKLKKVISIKLMKSIIVTIIIFLFLDCLLTCYAQKQFINRMIVEKNIEVENKQAIVEEYYHTYDNKFLSEIIHTFWNNEKMIKTFPNIKIEDKEQNIIYLDSLEPEIKPYYIKIFDK